MEAAQPTVSVSQTFTATKENPSKNKMCLFIRCVPSIKIKRFVTAGSSFRNCTRSCRSGWPYIAVRSDVTTGTKPCGGKFQPVSFQVDRLHENSLTQTGAFSFSQEL